MIRSTARRLSTLTILITALLVAPTAQQHRTLSPDEYGRWEQLIPQRAPLAPDGEWLVYGIVRSNGQNELRARSSGDSTPIAIPFGEQPSFSDDSRWLAYLIGFSEEQEAALRKEKKPLHKSLGILDLQTRNTLTLEGVESFAFSPRGTHLAMRRYAPESAGTAESKPSPTDDDELGPGTTLVVRELASGRDMTFGSVSEVAWQDEGTLLSMAITVAGGVGNGVQLLDTATGTLRVLDSSPSQYSGLVWRKDSAALAVLRSATNEAREGATQVALVWPDLATTPEVVRTLDASGAGGLPADLRVVRFREPQWSGDGAFLFVGVRPWLSKPAPPGRTDQSRRLVATSDNPDELPDVQVWHPADPIVMPRQKVDVRRERQRSMLAAWRIADARLVQISTRLGDEGTPIPRSSRALVVDTDAFAMERSIGRVRANAWAVDLASGARTNIAEGIEDRHLRHSPDGRYAIYLQDDHFWTVDLDSGRRTNITAKVATSFVDRESDATVQQKPPFGVAGWSRDDRTVLLYDKFDVWEMNADGSGAVRLTDGARDQIRSRYVGLDPEEEWIDRSQPLIVSQFGLRSKKSGYARVSAGPAAPSLTPLVWLDKRVHRLAKAERAERFAYVVEAFDDPPDYFLGDAGLDAAAQATTINPFFGEYAWGRSTIVEYRNEQGQALQGALFYPAGYEPGKRYPMVVYMYEKLSDGVHQFSVPSERSYYNAAAFTTRGYFYFQPDIVFRPREPGRSVVDCVVPAVQRVIEMGLADKSRIGILGHSWGGFDSVYLATHTNVFAAAVAGAPITNLVSNYGNHHWTSGIAETDHIETGQQRMEVPLYEDLPAYIRNSAVYRAHTMTTPLLVMFGDNDGTVHWHQGVELYNIARRAGKHVVLLQYGGEDHGLRKKANQIDYHHRIFEWFDHYLAGAAPAPWMTDGERYLDRERDLQQRKLRNKPAPPTTTGEP